MISLLVMHYFHMLLFMNTESGGSCYAFVDMHSAQDAEKLVNSSDPIEIAERFPRICYAKSLLASRGGSAATAAVAATAEARRSASPPPRRRIRSSSEAGRSRERERDVEGREGRRKRSRSVSSRSRRDRNRVRSLTPDRRTRLHVGELPSVRTCPIHPNHACLCCIVFI